MPNEISFLMTQSFLRGLWGRSSNLTNFVSENKKLEKKVWNLIELQKIFRFFMFVNWNNKNVTDKKSVATKS